MLCLVSASVCAPCFFCLFSFLVALSCLSAFDVLKRSAAYWSVVSKRSQMGVRFDRLVGGFDQWPAADVGGGAVIKWWW